MRHRIHPPTDPTLPLRDVFRLALALLAGALIALLAAAPAAPAATVAENGFSAAHDGYSFPNYGDGMEDVTTREMRKIFGKRVCAHVDKRNRCTLTPEAEAWMEAVNEGLEGGHCFGMAATAQFFYMGIGNPPSPMPFGAPTTPELVLDGNPRLQSHIAYGAALQHLPAVQGSERSMTPSKVIQQLKRGLKPGDARQMLTMRDEGGGHGVTPIAIEDAGTGKWQVAIYDNNYPGETRYVEVDTNKDTWSYEIFPGELWGGDAKSKSLGLAEPGAGLGRQPCFICPPRKGKPGSNVGKTMRLMWQGDEERGAHGSLVVRDQKGAKSGCGPKGCVNRIKGVRMHEMLTGGVQPWRLTPPPVFELPTRKAYKVQLGSTGLRGKASETVSLVGRGFSVTVRGIHLRKGETDTIKISRKARKVLFLSGSRKSEKPKIEITSSNVAGGAAYKIEIAPAGVDKGAGIAASFDPVKRVLILENRRGERVEQVDMLVTEYGAETQAFALKKKIRRGKVERIPLDD